MTLALTGPSGAALPPAAREAIQHAVAQAVPGVGAPTSAAGLPSAGCAFRVQDPGLYLW